MALPATTVIEVRTTGSDTQCAGGFDPVLGSGHTDYSQQDTAQATGTVSSSTTTVTATTSIFTSAMIGNYITDGTTFKVITAFTSATVVTVDSAPSWTAATIYVGGALASPGMAASIEVQGNTVYVKSGTYTIASGSANVATGVVSLTFNGSDSVPDYWIGYDTTRTLKNSDSTKPTFQISGGGGVTSVTVFKINAASTVTNFVVRNIIIDGNSKTAIRGFDQSTTNAGCVFENCEANNCTNTGFYSNTGNNLWIKCKATGCATQPAFIANSVASTYFACVAQGNTITGFSAPNGSGLASYYRCIADSNSGASSDGWNKTAATVGMRLIDCVSYNNGRAGVRNDSTNARGIQCINMIAYGNAGYGFDRASSSPWFNYNCAGGNNTSGNENSITQSFGFVTLSGDPFTSASGHDFSLNNTAGAGASCRAAAIPGAFPGGATTGYLDIGAAQHADPVGGGSNPVGQCCM